MSLREHNIVASLAKSAYFALQLLLMCKGNNFGPNIDPCGTPHIASISLDLTPHSFSHLKALQLQVITDF